MAEMTIEVPIKVKGGTDRESSKIGEEIAKKIKGALQSVGIGRRGSVATTGGALAGGAAAGGGAGGGAIAGIAASVAGILIVLTALDFIIKPVMQILKVVLAILFLPLIPILIPFLKKAGEGLPRLLESSLAVKDIVQKIVDFLFGGGFVEFGKNLFAGIVESIKSAWQFLLGVPVWIFENVIKPGFMFLLGVGLLVWEEIIKPGFSFILQTGLLLWEEIIMPGFMFLLQIGTLLWETIIRPGFVFMLGVGLLIWETILKPAWEFFTNIPSLIWDGILKPAFQAVANAITSALNFLASFRRRRSEDVDDFILRPNGQIIKTSPADTIIGTKDPEKLFANAGGGLTINVNNPVVREEQDIRKLTDMIARRLQGQLKRRIS